MQCAMQTNIQFVSTTNNSMHFAWLKINSTSNYPKAENSQGHVSTQQSCLQRMVKTEFLDILDLCWFGSCYALHGPHIAITLQYCSLQFCTPPFGPPSPYVKWLADNDFGHIIIDWILLRINLGSNTKLNTQIFLRSQYVCNMLPIGFPVA
mgnify:CR=1 FL=1